MPKSITVELPSDEAAEIQAEIRKYITEMQRANERIRKDQEEIQRLKQKTQAIITELREAL
jgi:methyl-accepting chemotaxis protein